MSEKKENREEEKKQSSSRSDLTDEKIEAALNACTFGQTKETRCKNCPLDSDKEPCITNLHLAALAYIRRLKNRAEGAETALRCLARSFAEAMCKYGDDTHYLVDGFIQDAYSQAEKELSEERKDD